MHTRHPSLASVFSRMIRQFAKLIKSLMRDAGEKPPPDKDLKQGGLKSTNPELNLQCT